MPESLPAEQRIISLCSTVLGDSSHYGVYAYSCASHVAVGLVPSTHLTVSLLLSPMCVTPMAAGIRKVASDLRAVRCVLVVVHHMCVDDFGILPPEAAGMRRNGVRGWPNLSSHM